MVDLSQISEQVVEIRKGASKRVQEGSWIDMVANTELKFKSSGRLKVSKGVSIKKTQPGPLAHLAESESLKYFELEYNAIPLHIALTEESAVEIAFEGKELDSNLILAEKNNLTLEYEIVFKNNSGQPLEYHKVETGHKVIKISTIDHDGIYRAHSKVGTAWVIFSPTSKPKKVAIYSENPKYQFHSRIEITTDPSLQSSAQRYINLSEGDMIKIDENATSLFYVESAEVCYPNPTILTLKTKIFNTSTTSKSETLTIPKGKSLTLQKNSTFKFLKPTTLEYHLQVLTQKIEIKTFDLNMPINVSKGTSIEFHSSTQISRSSSKTTTPKETLTLDHLDKVIFMQEATIVFLGSVDILELQLVSGQELPRAMLPEDEIDLMVGQYIVFVGKGVCKVVVKGVASLVIAKSKGYGGGDVMEIEESDIVYSAKPVTLTFRSFE